jgi:hypothetical protein
MTTEKNAWDRVESFLMRPKFHGFTADDLFIKRFIPKGWGQDIAALSNMAEAIHLRYKKELLSNDAATDLIRATIFRATHKTVSPYRSPIESVNDLGRHGYYLEHLNITLGMAFKLGVTDFTDLNLRISEHLQQQSLSQKNAHAPLMPNVKMRWSADQAAILHSLWLCDQNHQTDFHHEPADMWLEHMKVKMTNQDTGLFETEAMRVKRYSRQPRGCSLAYLIHYSSSFAPKVASDQWSHFKEHMLIDGWSLSGFREYLPSYQGKWTPDTGPILGGIGVAATGLGLKAASSMGDTEVHKALKRSVDRVLGFCQGTKGVPGLNMITAIGSDVLASAIYSNSIPQTEAVQ